MFPGEQSIGVSACVHHSKLLVCQDESSCMSTIHGVPLVQSVKQRGKKQGWAEQAEFLGCVQGSTSQDKRTFNVFFFHRVNKTVENKAE